MSRDYLSEYLDKDQRRGTTLWAVFSPCSLTGPMPSEVSCVAITSAPVGLIAHAVWDVFACSSARSTIVGFYSVTFDAMCPDDVRLALVTLPRDQFLTEDERRGVIDDTAFWSVLRHGHHVQFHRDLPPGTPRRPHGAPMTAPAHGTMRRRG
jgi:hypothetical protein